MFRTEPSISFVSGIFIVVHVLLSSFFFFFNDTATTEIYTLSLHDALPISSPHLQTGERPDLSPAGFPNPPCQRASETKRSEEHTSELQSRLHLVCRLLLEKKKTMIYIDLQPFPYHTSRRICE